MNPIEVRKLNKELIVRFSDKAVVLPEKIQEKIDTYWQSLLDSGKNYHSITKQQRRYRRVLQ
jgi:hypothetical protein